MCVCVHVSGAGGGSGVSAERDEGGEGSEDGEGGEGDEDGEGGEGDVGGEGDEKSARVYRGVGLPRGVACDGRLFWHLKTCATLAHLPAAFIWGFVW